jgi:membrane protease YdiL (CAAX protease family)
LAIGLDADPSRPCPRPQHRLATALLVVEVAAACAAVIADLAVPSLVLLAMAAVSLTMRHAHWSSLGFHRAGHVRLVPKMFVFAAVWSLFQLGVTMPIANHVSGKEQDLSAFEDLQGNLGLLIGLLVLGWILAAVVEELAYRGYLQTRMRQLFGSSAVALVAAVVLSSLLFGRVHSEQGVIGMLVVTIDGIVWSVLRYRYKTLWASVLAHGFKKRAPTPTAIFATARTTRSSSRASGLRGRLPAAVSCAIAANRVRAPVAFTSAVPPPSTMNVPAGRSSPSATGIGTLSPVNSEVSSDSACASMAVRSAEMRSPASSSTASPTTSSDASTFTDSPFRRTRARLGSRSRSRSAARSALVSCTNANTPLMITTTKIATPSAAMPATTASAPAAHNSKAKKWVTSASNCFDRERRRGAGRALGPSRSNRSAASAALSPTVTSGGAESAAVVFTALSYSW